MYFSRIRLRPELLSASQLQYVLQDNVYSVHRLLFDLFNTKERNFIFREEIAREQLTHSAGVRGEPIYYLVSAQEPKVPKNSIFLVESKQFQPKLQIDQSFTFHCRVNPVITKSGKKHDLVMNAQLDFLKAVVQQFELQNQLPVKAKKSDYKNLLLQKADAVQLDQYLSNHLQHHPLYTERLQQVSHSNEKLDWALKANIDETIEQWFSKQGEKRFAQHKAGKPVQQTGGFELATDQNGLKKFQCTEYQWHALPKKDKKAGFSSVDLTGELRITDLEAFEYTLFNGLGRSKAFGCGLLLIKRS